MPRRPIPYKYPRGVRTEYSPNRRVGRPAFSEVVVRQQPALPTTDQHVAAMDWARQKQINERAAVLDRRINFPMRRG